MEYRKNVHLATDVQTYPHLNHTPFTNLKAYDEYTRPLKRKGIETEF